MADIPNLSDLQLFVDVLRFGNFVRTASELGMSPSYVSKRIGLLEENLGVRLLHRTARQISPTAQGEKAYHWAKTILESVRQLQETLDEDENEPHGLLRVSTSFRLGRNHVAPALSLFAKHNPRLEISLTVVDRPVDLLGEGLDIDIRIGDVPEPHLVAHRILSSQRILCASPDYIQRNGEPQQLADLTRHSCLVFRERDQPFGTWRLTGHKGLESIKVTGRMSSNNNDIIRQWALDGHGIVRLVEWDAVRSLRNGELVHVLPGYRWPADVWAVTTGRLSESSKVRACVSFLREQLSHGPCSLWPSDYREAGEANGVEEQLWVRAAGNSATNRAS